MPTFRSSCYIAAPTFTNFGKSLGTSKHFDSSAAFLFEVPGSNSPPALQELQIGGTSAHFPKFVLHRGAYFHELRKVMGTSKHFDSSAAFLFEVPGSNSPPALQELQIGGARPVEFCSIAGVPGEAERKAV